MEERIFTLTVSETEANNILNALNEIPTKFGMPLIQKIMAQANEQVVAAEAAKSTPEAEAE